MRPDAQERKSWTRYVLGRRERDASVAALIDVLKQCPMAEYLRKTVPNVPETEQTDRRTKGAARASHESGVFIMARGRTHDSASP